MIVLQKTGWTSCLGPPWWGSVLSDFHSSACERMWWFVNLSMNAHFAGSGLK